MLIRFRHLLVWLLLLALPLQGYAAATMLNCSAGHDQVPVVLLSTAVVAAVDQPDPAHHSEVAAPTASAGHHHGAGTSKFKCSACAACCAGAGLPAAPLVFADAAPAAPPTHFCSIGVIGFLTDGPDRPPRTHLV